MPNTITGRKPDFTRRRKTARLTVVLSGAYVQAAANAGEVLDLSNILNPNFQPNTSFGAVPALDDFSVVKMPAGYTAEVVALTPAAVNLSNAYALKVYSVPGTELAAGAYPAALAGAAIYIEVNTSQWGQA